MNVDQIEGSSSFHQTSSFRNSSARYSSGERDDDEVELQWAAIERLPTIRRLRMSLFDDHDEGNNINGKRVKDVSKLGPLERQVFMEKLINHVEEDNGKLLLKMRERMDKMTLLLGPPGCGKTTLLKALTGKLDKSLKVAGEISYNGCRPDNLMRQKTTAYISQYDLLIPEMTVRETIDFSARCQGVESRTGIMVEISQREKLARIIPDPDIDAYMKAISINGLEKNLQTDYILKILGLDICADTFVGNAMRRGISGGQKRRLATGEMIVSPKRAFFMDEISNGLDSSTTFQIVTCLQQLVRITDVTALISLLQPAPETFNLFDDIILFAEGKIVYHGPRADILKFFEDCGFRCPERKGVAEFLQEVISIKDQKHYWYSTELPYRYITVDQFSEKFKASHIGQSLDEELSKTFDSFKSQQILLSPSIDNEYSVTKWELFKACIDREILLMRRNSSVHIFKLAQLVIVALITMTVYLRTRMHVDLKHSNYFMGSLFYGIIRILTNGVEELYMTVSRLPVFYKQRDYNFYPAWAYAIPASLLKVPFSLVESFTWTALTYYVIGYSPEVDRFLCQFLLYFALHQASIALFRFLASLCQNEMAAIFSYNTSILLMLMLGGYIIPQSSLPAWLRWVFWTCPLSYAEIGVSMNEFLASRWEKVTSGNLTIGQETLLSHGMNYKPYFHWIALGALFGFAIVFNIGFTLALTYLKSPATSRAIISSEKLCQLQQGEDCDRTRKDKEPTSKTQALHYTGNADAARMVLPFEPVTLTFEHVQYFVDTPLEMRRQGFIEKRIQLLHDMTGAFRPGILTALMGVSGAGITTLMDVLAGRKTGGSTEGDIRIGGFPKVQDTFARISGYCEQTDIHSPQVTVEESVIFSAWLRLPPEIDTQTRTEFVTDVLGRVELDEIKDALVGIPGISGLSNEQRKRLTIAVELVSNPSVIFMDEPTSGLDARAAAIVMRAVKNVVDTGRTVVCTIHQPSIDIFEAFDELILMKRGGQIIFSGKLGQHSSNLIDYFERIPDIQKIKKNYNPATWMLEITTESAEAQIGLNFAQVYKESQQYRENTELIKQLRKPSAGTREILFPTRFSCNSWEQYKACLWKQNLSYWRSPAYNFTRFSFTIISSVILGVLLWQKGIKIHDEQDMFNILSSVYMVLQLLGLSNCSSVIPVVSREQSVLYREKFSGMYSSWAYSFAQVTIEFPYIFVQGVLFVIITYPAIGFYLSLDKVVRYFHATFCKLLYYTYLGMLVVSLSPNAKVASILATASYTILNLFSGFLIPEPAIPRWWVWCYWISPTSWSLNALITSQYGDIRKEIRAFGETKALNSFLKDYFGYSQERLGFVTVILTIFPLLFASLFAYSVGKLNFLRR